MDTKIFVDILPVNDFVPIPINRRTHDDGSTPLFTLDPQFDGEDVFVTVYWRTPLDGYVMAGWPAPLWIVGNYDELDLKCNECVRLWL